MSTKIHNIRDGLKAIQFLNNNVQDIEEFLNDTVELCENKLILKNNKVVYDTDYILKDNNDVYVLKKNIYDILYSNY